MVAPLLLGPGTTKPRPVRLFVQAADQADAKMQAIEEDVVFQEVGNAQKAWLERAGKDPTLLELDAATARVEASLQIATIYAIMEWWAKGWTNVLRIGQGAEKGSPIEDALRALAIIPAVRLPVAKAAAKTAASAERQTAALAAAVDVNAKLGNCVWIACTRGARLSGQKLRAVVEDLAGAAGIPVEATAGIDGVAPMIPLLEKIGLRVRKIALPITSRKSFNTGEATMAQLVAATKNAKDSVIMFAADYHRVIRGPEGPITLAHEPMSHGLLAHWGPKGFEIIDRTGKVYRTLAELEADAVRVFSDLAGISKAVVRPEIVVFENAAIVPVFATPASITPGLLNLIGVEVAPALINETTISNGPRTPPGPLAGAKDGGLLGPGGTVVAPKPDAGLRASIYFRYRAHSGDTLATIAQRLYGDAALWRPIRDANMAVTSGDPQAPLGLEALKGLELIIPSVM